MKSLSDSAIRRLRDAADAPDMTGTKYDIIARVGQGGMGTVYRARDRELGRDVALKVIRVPEASPDVAARMLREARTLAQLEHPGIVPVHDVGTSPDGRTFYAMKLVRGMPLDAQPPSSLGARLRIVERICDAVAFAHAHGVIHRDLKPQNVMVGPFGEVLVMDWGVAKVVADATPSLGRVTPDRGVASAPSTPTTGHGVVLGTPGYMAPEQAAGDTSLVDARADVYAIGAILRDLCAAEDDGARSATTLARPLRAIILKAMAASPNDRYADVAALARDVAAFSAGEPVSAYNENLLERAQRLASRYRTPILLVVAYLVMRIALLTFFGR
ncbi:MAG TPA: serine/threonine-protein kinase [Gemmatimonadaceae bacterium]|nr:serine/threonine-protein kinase [Gemmatimonadaceae bacterium]